MRKIFPFLFLLMLLASLGCKTSSLKTASHQEVQLKILSSGIFEGTLDYEVTNQASPTGYLVELKRGKFLRETTTIPAKLKTTFGFYFYVSGISPNKSGRLVYSFPPMKNPETGKVFTHIETPFEFDSRPSLYDMVYYFAEDHELVCGKWTFQVFCGDQKLAEKVFTVVKAD